MKIDSSKPIEGFSTTREDIVLCLHNNGIDPIIIKKVKGAKLYYYKNHWTLFRQLLGLYSEKSYGS